MKLNNWRITWKNEKSDKNSMMSLHSLFFLVVSCDSWNKLTHTHTSINYLIHFGTKCNRHRNRFWLEKHTRSPSIGSWRNRTISRKSIWFETKAIQSDIQMFQCAIQFPIWQYDIELANFLPRRLLDDKLIKTVKNQSENCPNRTLWTLLAQRPLETSQRLTLMIE